MKKGLILISALMGCFFYGGAQDNDPSKSGVIALNPDEAYPVQATVPVVTRQEKAIYIPNDLRSMNLESDTSKWSFKRMVSTPDVALFWAKGFGPDIST